MFGEGPPARLISTCTTRSEAVDVDRRCNGPRGLGIPLHVEGLHHARGVGGEARGRFVFDERGLGPRGNATDQVPYGVRVLGPGQSPHGRGGAGQGAQRRGRRGCRGRLVAGRIVARGVVDDSTTTAREGEPQRTDYARKDAHHPGRAVRWVIVSTSAGFCRQARESEASALRKRRRPAVRACPGSSSRNRSPRGAPEAGSSGRPMHG